jgi:pyrimidine-specific ribonucleoside hydrolase
MIMNKMKYFASALLLAALIQGCAQQPAKEEQTGTKKVSVIFDTDIGPDYDDVGAIALLHAFADSGQARILATVASNKYEGIAGVLSVFNTYFNRPDIPIGVPRGAAADMRDSQHWSDTLLANYPHNIKSNAEAQDAVGLYRKILAAEPDTSVTIVTVGFLTNMANLLASPADSLSPLSGSDLVKQKVKLLVSMAGKFPAGKEFNVFIDSTASIAALHNWPTKVIYSGFEIGSKIKTGLPLVRNESIRNSPVKDAFRIALPQSPDDSAGRMSWDETAVLVGVKGYEPYYTLRPGRIRVAPDGSNTWDSTGAGQHYLVENVPPATVQEVIDRLMAHQPVR